MRKYEVDRIHNSKDGEIYQIAQSVEQKVRTGMLMPDYEMNQKPFHHWGDVILNYMNPERFCNFTEGNHEVDFRYNDMNNWFQTTCSIKEIENDGNGYVSEIWVDTQCMKCFKNSYKRQLIPKHYAVSISHPYNDDASLEFYDEDNEEWVEIDYNTMGAQGGEMIRTNVRFNGDAGNDACVVKINFHGNKIRIRSSVAYLDIDNNSVKAYSKFFVYNKDDSSRINKGIVLSRKKHWIYIESKDLHDVCVRHGGMKYVGENENTIYKITAKNSRKFGKNRLVYYGYSRPRNGRGSNYTIKRSTQRVGWIKCNWLEYQNGNFNLIDGGKTAYEVMKLLCRRHKKGKTIGDTHQFYVPSDNIHFHFILANLEKNVFELWNFILCTKGRVIDDEAYIKPIFVKVIPKEQGFKILEKKFSEYIFYEE